MVPLKTPDFWTHETSGPGAGRTAVFLLVGAAGVLGFRAPLGALLRSASASELYSHILLVPFVTAYLVWAERKSIFSGVTRVPVWGLVLPAAGIALYSIGDYYKGELSSNDYLSVTAFAAVLSLWGGFLLVFGTAAFRSALFPMLFLLFAVPVPEFLMDRIVGLLQYLSAEIANGLFLLTGVSVYRDGYVFQVPGLTIEVARQCGGIRSSLALLITSVVAGHLFLRTGWKKAILAASILPITVFKNAVRIVMLTLLGAYVDPRILSSDLHRRGGIPFFLGALVLLAAVLWFLRRSELREKGAGELKRSVDRIA